LQKIFEGNRGEIYLIDYFGKEAVLKRLRPGKPDTLQKEAKILRYLEPLGIAPKVYESGYGYIVMEYLRGQSFKSFLQKSRKRALKEGLKLCYTLDQAGVAHRELGRYYHFIATPKGLRVIDFERAQFSRHPRNVLQFVGFYMRDIAPPAAIERYKRDRRAGFAMLQEAIDAL